MEKEGKKVLITTFFEGYAVKQAILKLSPEKIIILLDEPKKLADKEKRDLALNSIEQFYKPNIIFDKLKISSYDIPKITNEVVAKIDEESEKGNKILIHVTEGRKIGSLSLLFSAYMRRDKIEGAHYITEEDHALINLPLLNFQINETKKQLLKEISQGKSETGSLLAGISDIGRSAVYQNLKELKQEGYISESEKKFILTDLGKIMIL
jgi:CRISPR locus-related DNA-binding protein